MAPRFTPKTLAFLRALRRNNNREWFKARKAEYEEHVLGPMCDVVAQLAIDFRDFAPTLVADPKRCIYRIYRDTRFSADKRPLKTQVAAVFTPRDGERHRSPGLYFHVEPDGVLAAGGLYMPDPAALHRLREHIAANYRHLDSIVASPQFRSKAGELGGDRLVRVPRPFPADHPAAEYLRLKQYLAGHEWPADFACSPRFYRGLLEVFRMLSPLVAFLDDGLRGRSASGPGGHRRDSRDA